MTFGLKKIDSKIIKFEQVGPDICHFFRFKPSDWRPSWIYANKKIALGRI